ncbi:unnamed protein product [Rangifer tarandus platyrhynchus]|uniref:Uncharacterized protein n=1 Tax=Rangifer tarandus platyrhynchus TaxID=3082113 RepID=A0AC59Z1C2_RANTA
MEIVVLGVFYRLLSGPQPFWKLLTSPPPCKEVNTFGKTGPITLPPVTFLCWRWGFHLTYICAFCPPSPEPASVYIVWREYSPTGSQLDLESVQYLYLHGARAPCVALC